MKVRVEFVLFEKISCTIEYAGISTNVHKTELRERIT